MMTNHQADQDNDDGQKLAQDFCLPDMEGRLVRSEDLRKRGAIVIIFCVGGLCPVNGITLLRFLKVLPELEASGASLVAVSPENSNEYQQISQQSSSFHFLLDTNNKVLGRVTEKNRASNFPAILTIGSEGDVLFSSLDSKDISKRVLPNDVIATLPGAPLTNGNVTHQSSTNTPKASKPALNTFMKRVSASSSSSKSDEEPASRSASLPTRLNSWRLKKKSSK
jgi:peroxiredoxin